VGPREVASEHFSTFVAEHTAALLRVATVLAGDVSEGEDLLQDTLSILVTRWPKVMAADSAMAYVRRALINRHISRSRPLRVRSAPLTELDDIAIGEFSGQVEDRDQLKRALGRLPTRQRTALVLRYFLDLDDTQIAAELGCRIGTVRSLISRALATLRTMTPTAADNPVFWSAP
jgi:RNA polymerase sigma-70 factor (sigma-E family)